MKELRVFYAYFGKKNLKGTLWLRYTGWVSLCQSLSELKVKS